MAITLRSVGASPGANSSNCIITKPAGLAVGDFMLAHVVNKATSGTITPPANWTIVGAQSNTASSRSALFYKFADAADVAASTFTFTLGTTGRNRGEMMALTGVDPTSPINAANQQINAAGTSIAVPTPMVTDGCTVLIIGSNALGGVASACSGSDPACTITLGYAVDYNTYCALACFSGVKSGTDAIDAHSLSTFTSAVSSGHAVALTPAVAPEEHSGPSVITGNGSVVGAVQKGGRGSALNSGKGLLVAIGIAAMMGVASLSGGGTLAAAGTKGAQSWSPDQEIITDGGMEDWISDTNLTSWTENLFGSGSTVNKEASVIHGGSFACRLDIDASNGGAGIEQYCSLPASTPCVLQLWYRVSGAGTFGFTFAINGPHANGHLQLDGTWSDVSTLQILPVSNGAWRKYSITFISHDDGGTDYVLELRRDYAISQSIYIDDVSLTQYAAGTRLSGNGLIIATGAKDIEQHSGSAIISGNGAVLPAGAKGGQSLVVISGNGTLATSELKAASSIAAISGKGSVSGVGLKASSGAAGPVSANGSQITGGKKTALVEIAIPGGGSLITAGANQRLGSPIITGGGILTATGYSGGEAHSGIGVISGGGALASLGEKSVGGAGSISAKGGLTGIGSKSAQGIAVISGGGSLTATSWRLVLELTSGIKKVENLESKIDKSIEKISIIKEEVSFDSSLTRLLNRESSLSEGD